ncbi:metallophosphoesterase family protein [Marivirga lumbricoides]
MKNFTTVIYIISVSLCFLSGCNLVEFNPNEIRLDEEEKDLNSKAITKIQSAGKRDTLTFVFMGDTQRFYDETDEFVESVNGLAYPIDFVIHAGDIADFGLAAEFKWVHNSMKKLKVPYLAVIGNHDLVANGPIIYRKMYGEFDFVFDIDDYRFIFFNSNSREYNFAGKVPDLEWIERQLEETPADKKIFLVSHVPPFSSDFDSSLEEDYTQLVAGNPSVLASLHGHEHSFNNIVEKGVRYFITASVTNRGYALFRVSANALDVQQIRY